MQSKSTSKKTDQLEFDFRTYDEKMEDIYSAMAADVQKEIDRGILETLIKAVGYNGSVDDLVKRGANQSS